MTVFLRKGAIVDAVQVTSADFNGFSFDGSPFSATPAWLSVALKNKVVALHSAREADYAEWVIKGRHSLRDKVVGPGDWIIYFEDEIVPISGMTNKEFEANFLAYDEQNLISALIQCRAKFKFYEKSHRDKPASQDTIAKAEANAAMSMMIKGALNGHQPVIDALRAELRAEAMKEFIATIDLAIKNVEDEARDAGRSYLHEQERAIMMALMALRPKSTICVGS